MTDVLITERIPGPEVGDIVPLDDRLQRHVVAGHAQILPNEHSDWNSEPESPAPTPIGMHGTGSKADVQADEDADEDTEG